MKTNNISLETIAPKKTTKIKIEEGKIYIPAKKSNLGKGRHYVYAPCKCKLPFRIDMTVKLNRFSKQPSQLTLHIGKGHIYFNGGRTNCSDIILDNKKGVLGDYCSPYYVYYNDIPNKDFVDISIMYGSQVMWISVDNKHCYATKETPYLKLLRENKIPDEFADGIGFSIISGTNTQAEIKSLTVMEYENDEPKVPDEIANIPEMSAIELFIKGLPPEVHDEAFKTDEFLMKDMESNLKFRRTIDKFGHLNYKSPCGFEYQIVEFGTGGRHHTYWVQSEKKPDRSNNIFNKLSESSPKFAEKMFDKLQICNPHSKFCKQRATIIYKSQTVNACMGKIVFKMHPSDFKEVRKVVEAVSDVLKITDRY